MSCPSRGTWIEMFRPTPGISPGGKSCPSRGTWIEILCFADVQVQRVSCPSRGTWIEMPSGKYTLKIAVVVPLTGHVDRNTAAPAPLQLS